VNYPLTATKSSADIPIPCDLPKDHRRDIPALVEWHRRASPIRMAELLVRTTLSDFDEA